MKMKCAKIREMLSNAIDNELPENERQIVADHLKICSECREFYEKMKALDAVLDVTETMALPENFSRRVINKLTMKEPARVIRWLESWKLRNTSAYATVAGIVLLSLLFGNYIGKFLYREIRSSRSHGNDRNSRMNGIAETRVNANGISCIVYDRINQEVHND